MTVLVNEPFLAGTPVGCSGVGDGRDAVLAKFVDFDALAIGTGSRNVVLNAGVDRFY